VDTDSFNKEQAIKASTDPESKPSKKSKKTSKKSK
jgi:hypothetical protein